MTNCRESEQHLGENCAHYNFAALHWSLLKIGNLWKLNSSSKFFRLSLLCSVPFSIVLINAQSPPGRFHFPITFSFKPDYLFEDFHLSFSKGSSKDTTSMTYYSTLVENHHRSLIALFIVRWDFMDRFSTTVCLLFNLFNLQKKVTLQVNLSMQSFEVSKENIISKAWNALKLKGIKFPSKTQNSAFLMASFCVG